jgi:hypothetical protein
VKITLQTAPGTGFFPAKPIFSLLPALTAFPGNNAPASPQNPYSDRQGVAGQQVHNSRNAVGNIYPQRSGRVKIPRA